MGPRVGPEGYEILCLRGSAYISKIGKPPPLPPNLGLPAVPPQTKHDASTTPSIPPPSYKESLEHPSAPPPSYEESLKHPSGPPDLFTDTPQSSVAPPSYDEASTLPSLAPKSDEAGSRALSKKGPDASSSLGPAPAPSNLAGLIESPTSSTSENAGVSLVGRLGDIALQGGTPEEIAAEYEAFFVGLSPEAIRQEMNDPDSEGSVQLLSDALQEGVKVTLRRNVNSSPWVTPEVVELIPDLG